MTTTLLTAEGASEFQMESGRPPGELWVSREALRSATGWDLRAEGLCRGEICVPLRPSPEPFLDGDSVHASALWRELDRPVLHDRDCTTWMLGEAAADRQRELETLIAPDFTLPDIDGREHSLSDFRGHKVLLATWASW
jgi:hypothetical protein